MICYCFSGNTNNMFQFNYFVIINCNIDIHRVCIYTLNLIKLSTIHYLLPYYKRISHFIRKKSHKIQNNFQIFVDLRIALILLFVKRQWIKYVTFLNWKYKTFFGVKEFITWRHSHRITMFFPIWKLLNSFVKISIYGLDKWG